jgi:S-(hydroxymethyl)glutathione dehydrogenase/alcohol dehydrogenase
MRIKAAVCYAADRRLVVEEVELDQPQAGEALVRITASSICHT